MAEARVPRFAGVSIFPVALTLYFALTTSVFLILGIQSLPRLTNTMTTFLPIVTRCSGR